jgi:hypothetical protein
MVASQAALDPFGTPAFFWVDIGIFRNASDMQRFTVWPVRARVAQLPRAQVTLTLTLALILTLTLTLSARPRRTAPSRAGD